MKIVFNLVPKMQLTSIVCVLLFSNLLNAQWIQTGSGNFGKVNKITVSGTNIYLAGVNGIYISTDNGTNWTQPNSTFTSSSIWCVETSGTYLIAGTNGDGAYISSNNGTSWTSINKGLGNLYVLCLLAVSDTNIFAGTWGGGIYRTTNRGTSWSSVNSGLTNSTVNALAVSGTTLFAGTDGSGVFHSTNNGANWSAVNTGVTNNTINTFTVSGTDIFFGANSGSVCVATNNGTSWISSSPGSIYLYVYGLTISGGNIFAGTYGGGVYRSTLTNTSANWTDINTGLSTTSIFSLAASKTYLFAGGYGYVWRRALSEVITAVEKLSSDIPTKLTLEHNYPNPFNPTTSIRYQVPIAEVVTLKVYDALGKEIISLANGYKTAGTYEAKFNGQNLSSGVYYYKLTAGDYSITKKMTLMK
jgi:hypothetical protein